MCQFIIKQLFFFFCFFFLQSDIGFVSLFFFSNQILDLPKQIWIFKRYRTTKEKITFNYSSIFRLESNQDASRNNVKGWKWRRKTTFTESKYHELCKLCMLRKKDEIIACFQIYFKKRLKKKKQTSRFKHDTPMLVPLSLLDHFYLDT